MSGHLAWEIASRAPDTHPFCVAAQTACDGHGGDAFIVALLHDALEDGYAEWDEIVHEFPEPISQSVMVLTRSGGERYMDYIERICREGGLALIVKRVDARVNLQRCRADGNVSRARRYEQALDLLNRAWSLSKARS